MNIRFVLNKSKEEKPTSLRVYIKVRGRPRFRLTTNYKILPSQWSPDTQSVIKDIETTKELFALHDKIKECIKNNRAVGNDELSSKLESICTYGEEVINNDFLSVMRMWIKSNQRKKSVSTIKNYNTLLHRLEKFQHHYDLAFNTINKNFEDEYADFLLKSPNPRLTDKKIIPLGDDEWLVVDKGHKEPGEDIGLFDSSINKDIATVKLFMDWALERDYHAYTKYKSLSYPISDKVENVVLSVEELDRLYNFQFSRQNLSQARDLALIEAYSGQRYSDVQRFLKEQFDFEKGVWKLRPKKGRKYGKEIDVHFVGYAKRANEILRKLDYKVPKYENQPLNRLLKEVCKEAGINEEVSISRKAGNRYIIFREPKWKLVGTHTFRRSACTYLTNSGLPIPLVMEFFGWKKLSTAYKYMHPDKKAVRKAMEETSLRVAN